MSRPRFEDLACPRCGHGDNFHVEITATAYLNAAGPSVERMVSPVTAVDRSLSR